MTRLDASVLAEDPVLTGLWFQVDGTYQPLAFTAMHLALPNAALGAFMSGGPNLIGSRQVPVTGSFISWGQGLYQVDGVASPKLQFVDEAVTRRIAFQYDGPAHLPQQNARPAIQDFARVGGTLACSSQCHQPGGAHLKFQKVVQVVQPRSAGHDAAAPLVIQYLRQLWWETWQLRITDTIRTTLV